VLTFFQPPEKKSMTHIQISRINPGDTIYHNDNGEIEYKVTQVTDKRIHYIYKGVEGFIAKKRLNCNHNYYVEYCFDICGLTCFATIKHPSWRENG